MAAMKELKDLVGTQVALLAPTLHRTVMEEVILHGVETAGVWIESQKMINAMLDSSQNTMAPKTLVFFLPWHEVSWIMSAIDVPSISTKAAE